MAAERCHPWVIANALTRADVSVERAPSGLGPPTQASVPGMGRQLVRRGERKDAKSR